MNARLKRTVGCVLLVASAICESLTAVFGRSAASGWLIPGGSRSYCSAAARFRFALIAAANQAASPSRWRS